MHIGLGTAALGRPQYINIRQESPGDLSLEAFRQQGLNVLEEAYHRGIRYFDTAPGYGLAEQLLIDWISDKKYADVEIATKWGYTYVANFDPQAAVHEVKDHSLHKLDEQWPQSQHLLPYLSSYQIHSATFESGVLGNERVLARLAELKAEHGLLIGLSSSGANQLAVLEKAVEIEVAGEALFDVFQLTYNILDQSLSLLAQALTAAGKRIVVKEALANGRLFPSEAYPHYREVYEAMLQLAQKYEVGPDAVALRFCIDAIQPFKVLSGASQKKHLTDNLKAMTFRLEPSEISLLTSFALDPLPYWQERKKMGWN